VVIETKDSTSLRLKSVTGKDHKPVLSNQQPHNLALYGPQTLCNELTSLTDVQRHLVCKFCMQTGKSRIRLSGFNKCATKIHFK